MEVTEQIVAKIFGLSLDKGKPMSQVIIYNQDNGILGILFPAPECLQTRTVMEIAIKDVPAGKRFKIVDIQDVPFEYPQETFVVSEDDLTDGIGGPTNEFN
jgi:hypothetical protein